MVPKTLPYYPMYAEDFNNDANVIAMSGLEVGIYILAINAAWTYGSIPEDPRELAVLIRKDLKEVKKAWPVVRARFVANGIPGELVNKRGELERERAVKKSNQARAAVSTRYVTDVAQVGLRNGYGNSTDVGQEALRKTPYAHMDSGSKSESQKGGVGENTLVERYAEFVNLWPEHRVGVDLGAQVWVSLVDSREITAANISEVFEGLERWKTSELWTKEGGKYIVAIAKADGTGWLQKRAWRDRPKQAGGDSKWL